MSELGLGTPGREYEYEHAGRRRRHRRRGCGFSGCLAVLVALAVLVGGGWFALTRGIDAISDRLSGPDDYPGPGTGRVLVEVHEGDTGTDIGSTLKSQGVVKSVEAFTEAFNANPEASSVQVGFYEMRKQMKASDAVEILVDPKNLITDTVTIPEGLRVVDIVDILAKETKYSEADFQKVLDKPGQLGLPSYAGGNPEGYLFPATYGFPPKASPASMLKAMVDRWKEVAEETDLVGAAEDLGYTPAELMTVASLVEAEGRGDDMPKIARVIYNRLENPDNGVTNGLLQVDASVNYALGRQGVVAVSSDELENTDSPYNTYKYPGLPPTPIEAPGQAAIEAAAHPADGPWLFYVTVDLATGETKFTDSYDEFLQFKQEFKDYCATQSDRC